MPLIINRELLSDVGFVRHNIAKSDTFPVPSVLLKNKYP